MACAAQTVELLVLNCISVCHILSVSSAVNLVDRKTDYDSVGPQQKIVLVEPRSSNI